MVKAMKYEVASRMAHHMVYAEPHKEILPPYLIRGQNDIWVGMTDGKGSRLVLERSEGMTSEGVTMTIEWKEIME